MLTKISFQKDLSLIKVTLIIIFLGVLTIIQSLLVGPNYLFAVLGCLAFILLVLLFIVQDFMFFVLAFYFLYGLSLSIMSNLIIESGAYMIEIQEQGFVTGSTLRQAFFSSLFIIGIYVVYLLNRHSLRFDKLRKLKISLWFHITFFAVLTVLLLYSFWIILRYGSPLWLNIDRFKYWTLIAPDSTRYIVSLIPQLNALNGIIFVYGSFLVRKLSLSFFLLSIIIIALHGEKYSGLMMASYLFLLPTLLLFAQNNRKLSIYVSFKVLVKIGLVITVFLSLVLFHYSNSYGGIEPAIKHFMDRIALQGQIWWAIDLYHLKYTPLPLETWFSNMFGLVGIEPIVGLDYLMYLIAPLDLVEHYLKYGVKFTMGYPAMLFIMSGWVFGALLQPIFGAFVGIVLVLLGKTIGQKDVFSYIFILKIYIAVITAFLMGQMQYITSAKIIIFILGFILVKIIINVSTNKNSQLFKVSAPTN